MITNQTDFGLNIAVKAMEWYEKYFGIPYALQKQGISLSTVYCSADDSTK